MDPGRVYFLSLGLMSQTRTLDELIRRIAAILPPGVSQLNEDVRKNLKEVLSTYLARMDLVTREEFEIQSAVLARTREKLDHLEAQVAARETQASEKPGNSTGTADGEPSLPAILTASAAADEAEGRAAQG